MMANYNANIKRYNGSSYDTIYPKTLVANVSGAATYSTYTATIPTTGWTGTSIDITITGILATDIPNISPVYDNNDTTAHSQADAWALIKKITTGANLITVKAESVPTTAIPIQLTVTRAVV